MHNSGKKMYEIAAELNCSLDETAEVIAEYSKQAWIRLLNDALERACSAGWKMDYARTKLELDIKSIFDIF